MNIVMNSVYWSLVSVRGCPKLWPVLFLILTECQVRMIIPCDRRDVIDKINVIDKMSAPY